MTITNAANRISIGCVVKTKIEHNRTCSRKWFSIPTSQPSFGRCKWDMLRTSYQDCETNRNTTNQEKSSDVGKRVKIRVVTVSNGFQRFYFRAFKVYIQYVHQIDFCAFLAVKSITVTSSRLNWKLSLIIIAFRFFTVHLITSLGHYHHLYRIKACPNANNVDFCTTVQYVTSR